VSALQDKCVENTSFYVFQMRDVVRNSTIRRSTFSTSFDKKSVRRPKSERALFLVLACHLLYLLAFHVFVNLLLLANILTLNF
jgi:hypothetical protein